LALVAGHRETNDQFDDLGRLPLLKSEDQRGNLSEVPSAGPKKFVVVHPGSGSEKKCWPLENFLKIMEFLHQKGIDGFLVTGEAENRIESAIPALALPPGWSWLRRPPLLKLAGLLRKAAFYVGNDSGVTHLAAACGTRGLALFRRDLEVAWKPYGRIDVLSDAELAAITLDSAIAKIRFFML
jgi:ADP-heptose:LPS heptosyltransferase